MALSAKLALRQSPSPVMTPQLRQAIKLLQLNNVELGAYVDAEVERNPLLERIERPEPGAAAPGGGDRVAAAPVGLRQHLLEQLNIDVRDPLDRAIGLHLIELVDEAGYLDADLDAVAARLGCGVARLEAALARLQGFEPTGVFARSLKECLALQLAERGRLDAPMRAVLDNLDLAAAGATDALARRAGLDAATVAAALAEIRRLDPKPGLAFGGEVAPAVIPDVLVRRDDAGAWVVELNQATLPRVLVDERYAARLGAAARSPADRAYLADRRRTATWLVRALAQRASTILRVATEVMHRQEGFLAHGVSRLRPLAQRQVAAAVGVHESTVSRVAANKYVDTPRGVFEMRYFFTPALAGGDGAVHAAEAVRHRIRELIAGEDAARPLSDERITSVLEREGVAIARRTVAKYRESMAIPSSARRRRRPAMDG